MPSRRRKVAGCVCGGLLVRTVAFVSILNQGTGSLKGLKGLKEREQEEPKTHKSANSHASRHRRHRARANVPSQSAAGGQHGEEESLGCGVVLSVVLVSYAKVKSERQEEREGEG